MIKTLLLETWSLIKRRQKSQLPSRRQLMRKTPLSGVDEKHPDSQIEHVEQTPVDSISFSSVRTSVESDTAQ